jgi:hypothetical protein
MFFRKHQRVNPPLFGWVNLKSPGHQVLHQLPATIIRRKGPVIEDGNWNGTIYQDLPWLSIDRLMSH